MLNETDETHLARTLEFWELAIKSNVSDGLLGFGRLALVEGLEQGLWAAKTLDTLTQTAGRIEIPSAVAERAAQLGPPPTSLAIMNQLVRGIADPGDLFLVAKSANNLLDRVAELKDTEEYQRLFTALYERGYRDL